MSNKNRPTILNVPLKKPTPGDVEAQRGAPRADLLVANAVEKKEEGRIFRFEDGTFLKFAINPRNPSTFVVHDAKQQVLAVTGSVHHAGMLCEGVNFLFAYKQAQQEKPAPSGPPTLHEQGGFLNKATHPSTDNLTPGENTNG